jgi:DNA modification methylase
VAVTSTIHVGDARSVLSTMPSESVHCAVTSPPYWSLRDYGVDGQIGLEETVDEWIRSLVAVFDQVHRVLRNDGTFWLNCGDAYAGSYGAQGRQGKTGQLAGRAACFERQIAAGHKSLQDAGWWVRDEIVWHKPCPMPEICRDRTTVAHEFLFLLTKRPRYFYDQEAIREPVAGTAHPRGDGRVPRGWDTGPGDHKQKRGRYQPKSDRTEAFGRGPGWRVKQVNAGSSFGGLMATRNKRSVWTIRPEPFSGAHFATFPTALVEPCVLAGTSAAGCCEACGAPLERIVRKGAPNLDHQRACGGDAAGAYDGKATKDFAAARAEDASAVKARILQGLRDRETVGWRRMCRCPETGTVPCTVLDPFAGSGTTGVVAMRHQRRFVGVELNPSYAELARKRIAAVQPLLFARAAAGGGA